MACPINCIMMRMARIALITSLNFKSMLKIKATAPKNNKDT